MAVDNAAMVRPGSPLLQVALNGSREHPGVPRAPAELAEAARASVDAGARVIHLHPYGAAGRETLEAEPCAAALRAVRTACPGVPVSLSTSAGIEPDPRRRLELIADWTLLPEPRDGESGGAGGRPASDNAALVRAAAAMIQEMHATRRVSR